MPFVEAVMQECDLCRQMRLRETGLGIKDITHNYFLLDSPIYQEDRGPLWPGALQAQQACGPAPGLRALPSPPPAGRPGQGDHALLSLPPGRLPAGSARTPRAEGRLSPAVHRLPPGDEERPDRLPGLPPQKRAGP
ncbi:MAG: hypothetical protein MZV70_46375 [Desulfobacterales bacterium]|nr:hypothetical protein [Desulfobacterales bacterium]